MFWSASLFVFCLSEGNVKSGFFESYCTVLLLVAGGETSGTSSAFLFEPGEVTSDSTLVSDLDSFEEFTRSFLFGVSC